MTERHAALAAQLQELQPLDLNTLRARWIAHFKTDPPALRSRELLLYAFAYRLQAKRQGDLSVATKRRIAELVERFEDPDFHPAPRDALAPGTALVREWNNARHVVLVEESGFRYRNESYASLTAAAKAITGTHWNGRRFFKLDQLSDGGSET